MDAQSIFDGWADEELAMLRDHYPTETIAEMARMIPGRSRQSIYRKAHELGVRKLLYAGRRTLGVFPDTTLAYLAGLFDGEGCVHIAKVKSNGVSPSFTLYVTVSNTDRRVVDHLFSLFGGNIKLTAASKPNHRDCYAWRASSLVAIRFLASIQKFSRIKTDQISLALEFSERLAYCSYRMADKEIALRESYRARLSEMKGMLFNRATNEGKIQ